MKKKYILDEPGIIIIGGGSFQGKSLVALNIAYRFNIPLIITTDTIRNFLHITYPHDLRFFTSTYLMTPENLEYQINKVSFFLEHMIKIYEKRGENLIIEGMHLSKKFISYASKKRNILIFALNNKVPFEKRIEYKSITRKYIEYYDPKVKKTVYGKVTRENISFTKYLKYSKRIKEIHREILENFKQEGLAIIDFEDISDAVEKSIKLVKEFINRS